MPAAELDNNFVVDSDKVTSDRTQNVTFGEVAETEYVHPLSTITPSDLQYEETLRSFLTRPYPILTGVWSTSSTRNTQIASSKALRGYLSYNNALLGKLTGFSLLRTQMEFILRINGTRFHYGALVMAWYPLADLADTTGTRHNVYSATMQPSTIVTPFADNVDPLVVPFVWPYHYLDITVLANQTNFGTLKLYVLAPLAVVNQTTSTSIPYTVYARCVNPVLTGFTSATPAVADPIVEQSMVGSSGSRVVAEAVNPYRSYGDDIAIRLGVRDEDDPASLKEHEFADVDNLYSNILSVRSYYNYMIWSSADLSGATILTTTVTPRYGKTFAGANDIRNYLGTVATTHRLWRGTLNYKLQIFASGFHTGRLAITWDPVLDTPTSTSTEIHNANRLIIDIQQQTVVEFSVPYAYYKPWRETTVTTQSGFPTLQFSVLNPLTTPSGGASSIVMVLWAYGSSTLKFALPRTHVPTNVQLSTPLPDPIEEQCYKISSDFPSISASHDVFPDAKSNDICLSIRDTCRRLGADTTSDNLTNVGSDQWNSHTFAYTDTVRYLPFMLYQGMFAAMRGSVRYAVIQTSAAIISADPPEPILNPVLLYGLDFTPLAQRATLLSQVDYSYGSVTLGAPSLVLEVPYLSTAKFWPCGRASAYNDSYGGIVVKGAPTTGTVNYNTYYHLLFSPGHDFCFGMQMAPLLAGTIGVGT